MSRRHLVIVLLVGACLVVVQMVVSFGSRGALHRYISTGMGLRYYVAATFLYAGLSTLAKRKTLGGASSFVCRLLIAGEFKDRLDAACRQRELDEALPSSQLAVVFGALQLLLAIPTALSLIPLAILLACLYCPLAAVLTLMYLRLRIARAKRYASLDVRDTAAVAPPYVWATAAVATVTPLLWLPVDPVGALLSTVSGIVILALGNRVAAMPSLLHGDDLPVERFLDVRLREGRTSLLLAIAIVPGFAFEVFSATPYASTLAHMAWDVEVVAFIFIVSRLVILMRKPPARAERAAWSDAAI
jgi:hypothetical protein